MIKNKNNVFLPLDAEKTPSETLIDRFQLPPNIEKSLLRSTLVFGARGSGKTMLLRWLRHADKNDRSIRLYGDLRKITNPVSNDTGLGVLSYDGIDPDLELCARAKTISCIAIWFAEECEKRDRIIVSTEEFTQTMPKKLRESVGYGLKDLYDALCYTGLEEFDKGPTIESLFNLLNEVHERHADNGLYLYLDRAEEAPYPSLGVILDLLDQSHCFTVMVAARPGLINMKSATSNLPTPGDHYSVLHHGVSPYTDDWHYFMSQILSSWLPNIYAIIPDEYKKLIFMLSRDSIRSSLRIVYGSIDKDGDFSDKCFLETIRNMQDNLLSAAQGLLAEYNSDIKGFLREIRKDIGSAVKLPLAIEPSSSNQLMLVQTPRKFYELSQEERFIYKALYTGLLTTLSGELWHPNKTYYRFEINPLLIWQEGDVW